MLELFLYSHFWLISPKTYLFYPIFFRNYLFPRLGYGARNYLGSMDVQDRHVFCLFMQYFLPLSDTLHLRKNIFYTCVSCNLWLDLQSHCILALRGCWRPFLCPLSHHPISFLYSFHPQVRRVRFNDFNWAWLLGNSMLFLGSFLWTCPSSLWEWEVRKEKGERRLLGWPLVQGKDKLPEEQLLDQG